MRHSTERSVGVDDKQYGQRGKIDVDYDKVTLLVWRDSVHCLVDGK